MKFDLSSSSRKDEFPTFLIGIELTSTMIWIAARRISITAIELCHRLIHSYVFVEQELEDKTIEGFFFASDATRSKGLWYLKLTDFISLLRATGNDYPAMAKAERDPKTGEWIFWQGDKEPPSNWQRAAKRPLR